MLGRVVAANGAISEGTREYAWIGSVKEVGDVEWGGGEAVEDAD